MLEYQRERIACKVVSAVHIFGVLWHSLLADNDAIVSYRPSLRDHFSKQFKRTIDYPSPHRPSNQIP